MLVVGGLVCRNKQTASLGENDRTFGKPRGPPLPQNKTTLLSPASSHAVSAASATAPTVTSGATMDTGLRLSDCVALSLRLGRCDAAQRAGSKRRRRRRKARRAAERGAKRERRRRRALLNALPVLDSSTILPAPRQSQCGVPTYVVSESQWYTGPALGQGGSLLLLQQQCCRRCASDAARAPSDGVVSFIRAVLSYTQSTTF